MLSQLAEPVSATYDADERTKHPDLQHQAAGITVAEAERPEILLLVKIACEATDGDVYSAWVADPGREPLLVGAYDPDLIPRSTAEYIVGLRHGVPRSVEVLDFDAFRNNRLAAAEGEASR